MEIIQFLLEDVRIDLNVKDKNNLTPMEKALKLKHWEIARMIAKKNVPIPKNYRFHLSLEVFLVN